jgi:glycosyltransferase involved in cell wall biosynthesis
MDKKPTVSIVTITQLKRFKCLEILHDLIKDQSYDNIIDWVIVEGSKTEEMAKENANNVRGLITASDMKININYIERTDGCKLGELRNRGNNACIGDITVAMDDDDYYPVDRVKHAVEMLSKSKYLIAGVSGMYIYDYLLKKLYIFKNFGPNHSVNSAMAWKKEYLKNKVKE